MRRGAAFSACRNYRYALWRRWDEKRPLVLFVGLNPSKADEKHDDPTSRRCIGFARSWGFGGLCLANLFAFCATVPKDLKAAEDPVGCDNDSWLRCLAGEADLVVAAWGNDGAFRGRSCEVIGLLGDCHCLGVNATGEPVHPLYQRRDRKPLPMPSVAA